MYGGVGLHSTLGGQKWVSDLRELESQAIVSHIAQVLVTELRSSVRAVHTLYHLSRPRFQALIKQQVTI